MEVFIFVGVVLVTMLITFGPLLFVKLRKSRRTDIAFERGVELATLLIHLPPASEDTDSNGRDIRDLVDENISKAQIIYNIIASTMQKNFKNRWHGQRHFSFEITGAKGFVYLYATVPADMIEVLKQAITSAYPSTRLEVATEHNIFSEVGGISSVVGGELNLKQQFAYPIATYQDLKRDALQSLLNALSSLDATDGAAIQILFRPVEDAWRKQASAHASKKRKGDDAGGASAMAKQLMTALVKPPEDKKENPAPKKELSSLEQSVLDAIDDKTRYAGFEVTIRIVASSNILQRSQAIINNIVASFALFDSPGRNGFKYEPAKDPSKLVADYVLRVFTARRKRNIMNAVELATIFHFPDQRSIPTSQLSRQESKQVDGPRNMPDSGLLLGFNVFRGVKKPIRLALKDRQRHLYAVGQTGTGKSTFLESLALQDMLNGDGFAFVDPHGDTAEKLLSMVPKERTEDVIYFCPSDMDYPMGLNLFEYTKADQKDFLVQETLNMLQKLYDPQHQGIMGPRYEHIFRNAALAIMADPNGGTFVDVPKLFRDPDFLKEKLKHVKDPSVLDFWQKEYPASQRSNEAGEVTSWFVSKFGAFLSNEMMRNIIGQTKSAFDLRYIMDNKKILLVNLSKGRTGELNSKLLGMIFVMKFQAAAMSRSDIPEEDRKDFALYVDEFQNFSTDSFATIMSEARKFHLNLIVANQFTTQLTDEIRDAVFGNIGTVVSFRIGQNDVEALGRYFQPTFDGDDLLRVPNYNAIVRTLVGGVPTQPFSMATLPPFGNPSPQLAAALKQLSAAKYGKPKAVVEKEIFDRLSPKMPTPAVSAYSPNQSAGGFAAPSTPKTASGSFLDDWLAKQRAGQPSISAPAFGASGPTPGLVAPTAPTSAHPSGWSAAGGLPAQSPVTVSSVRPTVSSARPVGHPSGTSIEAPVVHEVPEQPNRLKAVADNTELVIPKHDSNTEPAKSVTKPAMTPAIAEANVSEVMPDEGGNVSSTQLDEKEIHDIATELKKDLAATKPKRQKKLKTKAPKSQTIITAKTDDLTVKPAPVVEPEPVKVPTPQLSIIARNHTDEPAPEDTIFIDADGKLVLRDAEEQTQDKA